MLLERSGIQLKNSFFTLVSGLQPSPEYNNAVESFQLCFISFIMSKRNAIFKNCDLDSDYFTCLWLETD